MKNKKKILIIGGAGFIGHNLAIELVKNYDVEIIDSLMVNNLNSVIGNVDKLPNPYLSQNILYERFEFLKKQNIPLHIQDARDYSALSHLFNIIKPDIVIHLAAVSHATRSNKDPYSTFDHSFRTLENALDNSRGRVSHFIYFSSSMVYGNFKSNEVDESSICEPLGIYAALKYSGEKIVKAYNQTFDLPFTIIRPSALYGQRCISRRVTQIFIENAINNQAITINGDGDELLDFTYIKDLCMGIKLVIEKKESLNEIFNITYGSAKKIINLIDILKEFFDLKIEYKKRDKLMPKRGTLSVNKAKNLLNYDPAWNLDKGYRDYIKWYLNFKNFEK